MNLSKYKKVNHYIVLLLTLLLLTGCSGRMASNSSAPLKTETDEQQQDVMEASEPSDDNSATDGSQNDADNEEKSTDDSMNESQSTPPAQENVNEEENENEQRTHALLFIHHSCGENWLQEGDMGGGLCRALNDNGIAVADITYGWYAPGIEDVSGDTTDTTDWPNWFTPHVMEAVYQETGTMSADNLLERQPEQAENDIILFKSCYPCSDVGADFTDEQAIYNELLPYFQTRPDKLFVLVTPPPMQNISHPDVTRELCNWLADREAGWLADYTLENVRAFDFYSVLTHPDNRHCLIDGLEQHIVDVPKSNELYYYSGDDHPNGEGNRKATEEFVPLLMKWIEEWESTIADKH